MNRFRTKKKSKEDTSAGPGRSSSDEAHSFMGFRRNKKSHEEEKKELDLANALPPSDDFRTSLLMTGLSARFSMLREQDDPNSKIGKASDDSVLFPNRQSRLMELGFRGLDDIAEVESIRAPPPFLRTNSFGSDAGSTSGSVLTRARPTEGNNLFGGRQKIYRINTATASSKNVSEGGMGGRALYESDVALSAFQKLRQKDKERFLDDDDENDGDSAAESKEAADRLASFPRSDSPSPVDFNLRRETSSTTSSVGRNSTAATSVASQSAMSSKDWHPVSQTQSSQPNASGSVSSSVPPIERTTTTRTRRLYEQGLNQDLHEHQSSALSRFDTLAGKRPLISKLPELTSSASSPNVAFGRSDRFGPPSGAVASALERLDRQQARSKTSSPNLRSTSPPVASTTASTSGTTQEPSSSKAAPASNAADAKNTLPNSPPLGSPASEPGELQLLSIQPNDLGKATALGMFQKPSLPYDESRFAQRQLQRQHGRETPTERIQSESEEFLSTGRSSRSSSTTRQPERAAPLRPTERVTPPVVAAARKTFLFDDDDEDDSMSSVQQSLLNAADLQAVRERPSDADHPAFRQAAIPGSFPNTRRSSKEYGVPELPPTKTTTVTTEESTKDDPVDSPTLPGGSGLTGMVLQHLRSSSNASSVYSVADGISFGDSSAPASRGNTHAMHLGTRDNNPWEGENWTASVYSALGEDMSDTAPSAVVQEEPQQAVAAPRPPIPDTHKTAETAANNSNPSSLRSESPRSRLPSSSVAGSARSSNNLDRDDEMDDFASQLATARKRVQERLTTYVESDSSRNTSPLLAPVEPVTQPPPLKANTLGGLLRAKSSRGSLMERTRDASQSKTFKILGIGAPTTSALPSPSKQSFDESQTSTHTHTPAPAAPTAAPPIPPLPAVHKATEAPTGRGSSEASDKEKGREDGYFAPRSSPPRSSTDTGSHDDGVEPDVEPAGSASNANGGGAGVHPGLQAFRNARRQLQRQKVLETQARHQGNARQEDESTGFRPPVAAPEPTDQQTPSVQERRGTQTTPNRDRGPPPVHYQRRDPSQESSGRSRSNSRTSAQTERERSGSDGSTSGGYTNRHVPPRLRPNHTAGPPQDEYQPSGGHLGPPRVNIPMRSPGVPGLPGTDIRRSPHMPPTGIPGGQSLSVQTALPRRSPAGGGYGPSSNQPSPISPLGSAGLPVSPYHTGSANASGPSTPSAMGGGPRTPRQQGMPQQAPPFGQGSSIPTNGGSKKPLNKNEISEPTFIMSTSRVPTMSLPQSESAPDVAGDGSRSQSGSRTRAGSNAAMSGMVPPLPPINPMRKQPATRGPRGFLNGMLGRRGDGGGDGEYATSASTPNLALATGAGNGSLAVNNQNYYPASPISDNEGGRFDEQQRTLRRQASEATGMHSRMAGAGPSNAQMDLPGGMI